MKSNWHTVKLQEIVLFKTGKLDSNAADDRGLYPFFTCSPVTLAINNYAFDTEAVLLAGNNANGVFAIKYYKGKFNAYQRTYVITPIDKSVVSVRWLYFRIKHVTAELQQMSVGTATKFLTKKILDAYEVQLPPIEEQERQANILWNLQNKLDLNDRVNQTLEQMAQAIFKSWFVDFDPVKAKMNGGQPEGMDSATASLFPEKLVESELGLIPEGWEVSTLSSLIQLTGGGTPKRSEETYWNGDIPWFSVRDVPSGSNVFVVDTDEKITELGLNKSSTKLLPKGTTIITARGTVGKLALVGTDMCMNQSCYGIRCKEVGDYYNYFNLKQAVSTLQQNTHGAVFDTITTKTFDTYSLAFGGVELANKFDALIAPLLQKIEANVRQNIELSALRDTLLPKLLSGEIELGQAQELAEVE
ncbi:restriction endonuclease subunit S [Morganella morganii]|uniref:restriction endonuclease subunit S n=1 Tax=Morganella morganii TaxID=582 RepID=UPI0023681CF5|nr:restriction endonuclease subunit S [Morganella morganii]